MIFLLINKLCFSPQGSDPEGRLNIPRQYKVELLMEDGFKFAGIASWLIYFARYAVQQIETIQETGRSV
jgi:hypothetical protein